MLHSSSPSCRDAEIAVLRTDVFCDNGLTNEGGGEKGPPRQAHLDPEPLFWILVQKAAFHAGS